MNIIKKGDTAMKRIITLLAVSVLLCLGVNARLSPAMDIIAQRLEIRKCTTPSSVVTFSAEDFDNLFGREFEAVKVRSLPEESAGVLTLSGIAVREGQTVDRENVSRLCFAPSEGFTGTARVVFESGDATGCCALNVLEKANFAPQTGSQTVNTQRNIAVYKTFSAADPDNDRMTYEFAAYPRHGSVQLTSGGEVFVYSPADGFVGEDSFSYTASDIYGNKTQEQTVKIKVSRPAADVYFEDMKKHWAHNSAIRMAATGLMTGESDGEGRLVFNPDLDMTRGDFLALSLIMAGHEKDIPFVSETGFADDSLIPANIRSYAQYAYDKGIISGFDNGDDGVNFESASSITKAEAAVIVDRILGLPEAEGEKPAYKDAAAIPAWAGSAITNLSSCGIINGLPGGEILPEKTLTRAEGAEMICNVASYIEDKAEKEKPKRNLFNLFGLLA